MSMETINLHDFLRGYIECALWSTTDYRDENDDAGYNLDDEFCSVSENCEKAMRADCDDFIQSNLDALIEFKRLACCDDAHLGFLFWLNRNGHGSGFWDELTRGEDIGDTLSDELRQGAVTGNTDDGTWYARFAHKWRKVYVNMGRTWIVCQGEKITIRIEGV